MFMRYCVLSEWNYRISVEEPDYDRCSIYPSQPDFEDYDGENCVCGSGYAGYNFNIYNSLEEAIISSGYNPDYILFENLTEDELKEKDKILNKYIWTYENGYEIKNKEIN